MNENLLQRWLAFGQAMQKAGSELPRHLVADTQAALSAQQQTNKPVAWLSIDCIGERYLCFSEPSDNDEKLALYAAPPRAQLLRVAELVREECAKRCDEERAEWGTERDGWYSAKTCAEAARAVDLAAIVDAILAAAPKPT